MLELGVLARTVGSVWSTSRRTEIRMVSSMDQIRRTASQEEVGNGRGQHCPGRHSEYDSSAEEHLSESHRGAVANDRNHFSILASNPKGLVKRCRGQDNASTEFLICSLPPTRVLNMKYKIV